MDRLKSWFRNFLMNTRGFVDVGTGIAIGILFAGLMVIAYIVWTLQGQLYPQGAWQNNSYFQALTNQENATYNSSWGSLANVTSGFDNTVTLLLIVVVIWLLALAIMALLIIKKKSE